MVDCVDEEGEPEDVGEEDEFLSTSRHQRPFYIVVRERVVREGGAHMSHIAANLSNSHQEVQGRHPLSCT